MNSRKNVLIKTSLTCSVGGTHLRLNVTQIEEFQEFPLQRLMSKKLSRNSPSKGFVSEKLSRNPPSKGCVSKKLSRNPPSKGFLSKKLARNLPSTGTMSQSSSSRGTLLHNSSRSDCVSVDSLQDLQMLMIQSDQGHSFFILFPLSHPLFLFVLSLIDFTLFFVFFPIVFLCFSRAIFSSLLLRFLCFVSFSSLQ